MCDLLDATDDAASEVGNLVDGGGRVVARPDADRAASYELIAALATLGELPDAAHRRLCDLLGLPGLTLEEHTEVFVLQCHPYAAFHLSERGMLGGEAADRVAGFWRALGFVPPAEPDHITALLGLYARLGLAELDTSSSLRASSLARARQALLFEHVLSWVPVFLASVAELGSEWAAAWATLVRDALVLEAASRKEPTGLKTPLSLALRAAPAAPDPEAGPRDLAAALCAPVCSGMVLTKGSLELGAAEVEIGMRAGERRFVLEGMLTQAPRETLAWLARQGHRWAQLHRSWAPADSSAASWWEERARATAELLAKLASAA